MFLLVRLMVAAVKAGAGWEHGIAWPVWTCPFVSQVWDAGMRGPFRFV